VAVKQTVYLTVMVWDLLMGNVMGPCVIIMTVEINAKIMWPKIGGIAVERMVVGGLKHVGAGWNILMLSVIGIL
jgi:hypothetical protein